VPFHVLKIICGICVVLVSLHLVHALHHFHSMAIHDGMSASALWGGLALGTLIGIFSLTGGILLLMRK
jgi:hypothetical protein